MREGGGDHSRMADSRIPRGTERCRPVMMTALAPAFAEAPLTIVKSKEHSIRFYDEQASALVSSEQTRKERLATQTEFLDQNSVATEILAFEIVEKATSLAHDPQQTAA